MINIAKKSKLLHVAVVMLVAFVPALVLFDAEQLYILLGAVLCTSSVSVVHAYWPTLKIALRHSISELNFVDYLTMGIVLIFAFTAIREGYVTYNQVFNPLRVNRSSDFFIPLAFTRYGAIVAAYMALAARHFLMGPRFMNKVPGWPRAVLSVLTGSIVGGILLFVSP